MIESARKLDRPKVTELSIHQKGVSSPIFLEKWPAIAELLIERLNIKKPRQTPTVTMYFDGHRLAGCLNDRWKALSLFGTADDVLGLMQVLNDKLLADKVDWREGRPWGM